MKKLMQKSSLLLIAVICLLASSCKEDEVLKLEFSGLSGTHHVQDLGGLIYLPISANVEWDVDSIEEQWITARKENNQSLLLKIEANTEENSRTAKVTIREKREGGNILVATLTIIQKEMSEPRIEITNNGSAISYLTIEWETKDTEVIINSNTNWKLKTDADWLSTSVKAGEAGVTKLTITAQENTELPRNGILAFTVDGGKPLNFVVAQNGKQAGFGSPTHYFYVTFGTMPTLYAGLHALSHDKPSYFAYERHNTFDPEMFPPHITLSVANGLPNDVQIIMRDYIKKKIIEVRDREPNAIFGLYVDDLRCRLGNDWFVAQGIDSARVKVTMLSDGTGTYHVFSDSFGNEATGEKRWKEHADWVNNLSWQTNEVKASTRVLEEFNSFGWTYYMATLPNYRLLLQDATLLETNSSYVKEEMKKMKTISVTPYELLENLSESRKSDFFKMARFDRVKFSALFDKSPKKNMVIIGTSGQADAQKEYVKQVYDKYRSEYDIFFKPHPADNSSAEYEETFKGLTLLPGQMPFEIFVWSLIDKIDLIGGFSSTVFLTVPIEKIGFLFGVKGAEQMVKPLNLLFKDADHIEWMNL